MNHYEANLNELSKYDPGLALKINSVKESGNLKTCESKTSQPTLMVRDKNLHSTYDPEKEGKKWANDFVINGKEQFCVLGFGLGYHVKEVLNRIEDKVYVIEPSLEILKAAFQSLDLREIIPKIHWIVAKEVQIIIREYSHLNWQLLPHNPSINLLPDFYNSLIAQLDICRILEKIKLKILVVNPIYGGSLPTANYVKSALLNLGHEVEVMDSEKFHESFFQIPELTSNEVHTKQLINLFTQFLGEATVAKAAEVRPDLIIAMAQAPLGKEALLRLKDLDVPLVFWFVEDFRTLTYWEEVSQYYDYIFTIQRGVFFDKLKSIGIKNYYYLPQACDPGRHCGLILSDEEKKNIGSDLSFMGAGYYNRKVFFKNLIDFNFKIWGSEWDLSSPAGKLVQKDGARVTEDECVKIYNVSKINLNLHSSTFHEGVNPLGDFVNPRTFEIAACGGFQLVDYRSELPELFEIGTEIICYKDIDDLRTLIKFYLENPEERIKIATEGQLRVRRNHTFENRMREMLSIIYEKNIDKLKLIASERKGAEELIKQAGPETELGKYLMKFKDKENLCLKDIIKDIEEGKGSLTKEESIFLIMNQFIKEKGRKLGAR